MLKSRPLDTLVGKPLTNARIDHYMRQGVYGPSLQAAALAREKARKAKKEKRRSSSTTLTSLEQLKQEMLSL